MRSIFKLSRERVRVSEACIHGGEVWDIMKRYGIPVDAILDFSSNINPLGPPPKVLEAIKRSFWQIPFYPDSDSNALRDAIAKRIGGVDASNVIVGNGSTELIHLFAEVFIEKGDEVLIPAPTFGEYEHAVRKVGGVPKHIRLVEDFSNEVSSQYKALFVCNPNNPTSLLTPRNILQSIIEKASEVGMLVFLDEDFMEFVKGEKRFTLASQVEAYKNLFVLRSFTKIYALTGLRVGYGIASKEIIDLMFRVKLSWNVNSLAHVAAIESLKDEGYIEETWKLINEERNFLSAKLRKVRGFEVSRADANFILVDVRGSGFTAAQLKDAMLKHGILIRDCSSFRGLDEYFIRVAVRRREENQKLIDTFNSVVGA